jgi:hypothetical protein
MPVGYRTYKIEDFIKKTPMGDLDFDASMKIIREIATASGVHHDHNLLIDLRQTVSIHNFHDLLKIAAEFSKYQSTLPDKIAFIIPNEPERIEKAQFFMKSLDEASLKTKYFMNYEKAIEWFSSVKNYPDAKI